jgi:hypothetical protein
MIGPYRLNGEGIGALLHIRLLHTVLLRRWSGAIL